MKLPPLHRACAGFLAFFALNILVVNRYQLFGMVPVTFFMGAVMVFTIFILAKANRMPHPRRVRLLNLAWCVLLGAVFVTKVTSETLMYYGELILGVGNHSWIIEFISNPVRSDPFRYGACLAFASGLVAVTVILKNGLFGYAWMRFTSFALLGYFLMFIVVNPMPLPLWQYEGVFALPAVYGLLMISFCWIHEEYVPVPGRDPGAAAGREDDDE